MNIRPYLYFFNENKKSVMLLSKSKKILLTVWILTVFVWLPPVWYYFFQTDYFFWNVRGLQNFAHSAPVLLIILSWAVVLSIPKTRTQKSVIGAGSSFLTIGFLLQYYAMFHQTGGLIILFAGLALLNTLRGEEFKQL